MMFVAFKKGTVGFPLGREKGGWSGDWSFL